MPVVWNLFCQLFLLVLLFTNSILNFFDSYGTYVKGTGSVLTEKSDEEVSFQVFFYSISSLNIVDNVKNNKRCVNMD